MIETTIIEKALKKAANQDLRLVDRENEISICQTKVGTATLSKAGQLYRLAWSQIGNGRILTFSVEGNKDQIRNDLMKIYTVA